MQKFSLPLPLTVILFASAFGCSAAPEQVISESVSTVTLDEQGSQIDLYSRDTTKTAKDVVSVRIVATVEAVDLVNRKLTVVGPNQRPETFFVGPEVRRLNEIRIGDRINLEFFNSVLFEVTMLSEEDKKNPRAAMIEGGRADLTNPPAAGALARTRTVVNVQSVDLRAATITVKTPEGEILTVQARHPERLERVKAGDYIAITSTESVVVSVSPVGPKG